MFQLFQYEAKGEKKRSNPIGIAEHRPVCFTLQALPTRQNESTESPIPSQHIFQADLLTPFLDQTMKVKNMNEHEKELTCWQGLRFNFGSIMYSLRGNTFISFQTLIQTSVEMVPKKLSAIGKVHPIQTLVDNVVLNEYKSDCH